MPDPQLLSRGKIENLAIGIGASYDLLGDRGDARIWCEGDEKLVVEVDMTGTAAGDLAVQVNPYEADNATVMPLALPAVRNVGPTLAAGHVYASYEFDVKAYEMVRVRLTNNNVAGQTITRASWRLQ